MRLSAGNLQGRTVIELRFRCEALAVVLGSQPEALLPAGHARRPSTAYSRHSRVTAGPHG